MMKLPLNVDFTGKVVVVTGAGGVLCGEMARAYAQAGAKVAALDLNEEAVKKLADELTAEGFICKGYKANVLDAEALEAVHQQVLADLGPCDILINGAGGNNPRATTDNEYQHEAKEGQKTFFDLEPNGVDFVFKLNFQGTLLPTQAFAKDMVARKSGNILNISSMNAYIPLTKIPAYSGAKAAISNFTQWLAPATRRARRPRRRRAAGGAGGRRSGCDRGTAGARGRGTTIPRLRQRHAARGGAGRPPATVSAGRSTRRAPRRWPVARAVPVRRGRAEP